MLISRAKHNFFDDLANFILCTVSLTLTHELYLTGKAGKYKSNHRVLLTGKQIRKNLLFYPSILLDKFFHEFKLVRKLNFEEEPVNVRKNARLKLSAYEKPLFSFAQSMFINYFERFRLDIEQKFGNDTTNWPTDWNFARVVRNSISHSGCVNFQNLSAAPVSWLGLTYSPADNGRKVLFYDLWFGDLIYLMIDMDRSL